MFRCGKPNGKHCLGAVDLPFRTRGKPQVDNQVPESRDLTLGNSPRD